jgi:hypothetical protein
MVRIIYDAEHLVSLAGEQTVSNISEYVGEYGRILDAMQSNQDLRLVVHNQTVFHWLRNLSLRYPQGSFDFQMLDARQALRQKWGVELPDELRNEEIQETGLLTLDLQPQPGQSFEDILLTHFYAPLFSAKTFPFTQLAQLFDSIDSARWQANRADPLLARTLHQRLETWKNKARSTEQRQVIEWFGANPFELQKQLMAFRVLRAYPAISETLLGEAYPILVALKLQLQDLRVDEKSIPAVVTQVTYQLNAYQPQSAEELKALIGQVSGLLWVEFETLEKLLLVHPDWISLAILDQMEEKFDGFSQRIAKRLRTLRLQIQPTKPNAPNNQWEIIQMLAWATSTYLPYQAWCSAHEQFDKDLYTLGDQFSEWLVNNWNDIHSNSGRMIFNILPNISAELINPQHVHLILVVDNLGWSFAEALRDLFQEKGFYLLKAQPYLAMLPTETETSKKCLLSGAVGYTAIDDKNYKDILETGWIPYFSNDNAFRYISDIGKLNQVEALDARAYVVNYLAVDKALHKSADEIGMPHREHVRYLLEKLVENVEAFIEKHALGDRIRIHIVSDHGSTQIPAGLQNDIDQAFFKQTGFEARSHRYLEVSNERFSTLPDNLKQDCFFLPAGDYLLPTNVLCARRANRFLPTDKDSFVHGGILPEEVIVPYMAFEPATVPLQNLDVLLIKNLFRYRLETVELKIGNPNEAAVEQVRISSLNGNVEWEFGSIPLINGHHDTAPKATARFKLTSLAEEQTTLNLRVRFRCRGEIHAFDIKLPIEIRKMVEEKSTTVFDD